MTTESGRNSVYQRIAPWLGEFGVPARIENAIASGLPDIIYVAGGKLIYIELKIMDYHKIILRRYQNAYASRCTPHVDPQYFWFLCATPNGDKYEMYMWRTIRDHVQKEVERKLIVDLKSIDPDFFIYGKKDVENWLQFIKDYET